jgi:hypothetical protein
MNAKMRKLMLTTLSAAALSAVAAPASAQFFYVPEDRHIEWRERIEDDNYLRSRREADRRADLERRLEARESRSRLQDGSWAVDRATTNRNVRGPVLVRPLTQEEAVAAGLAPLNY